MNLKLPIKIFCAGTAPSSIYFWRYAQLISLKTLLVILGKALPRSNSFPLSFSFENKKKANLSGIWHVRGENLEFTIPTLMLSERKIRFYFNCAFILLNWP